MAVATSTKRNNRTFRSESLHRYLTRVIWLCMLPPLALAGWLAFGSVRTNLLEFDKDANALAQMIAFGIDAKLRARAGALQVLTGSPDIHTPERWHNLYAAAKSFQQRFGSHVVLAAADDPMPMLFNTRVPFGTPLPDLPMPKGRAAAPIARETGKQAVGDIFTGPIANQSMVAIVVPAMHEGRVTSLLLTAMETQLFEKALADMNIPPDFGVRLLDGAGSVIASRPPARASDEYWNDAPKRYIVASKESSWSTSVEIPRRTYWAHAFVTAAKLALAVLMVALVGLVGGRLASRSLNHAVRSLLTAPGDAGPVPQITEIVQVGRLLRVAEEQHAIDNALLRDSDARFQTTFEIAAIGIAMVDTDGRWLRVNRKLCEVLGYTQHELMETTFQAITHPDDLDLDLDQTRRVLEGQADTFTLEKRYIRKDGRAIWCNLTVAIKRKDDGQPHYFISVVEDIQDRKEAEAALRRSEQQLHALYAHLEVIREDERTRLAREVHDVLGQLMTGIAMDVAWIRARIEKLPDEALRAGLSDRLTDVNEMIATMIKTVQEISSDLRPSVLDNIGLNAAIRFESARFERRLDMECELDVPDQMTPALEPARATAMFRIFQELLTNIARHAGATRVHVRLASSERDVTLTVSDNGRGITREEQADVRALGLLGMRERVAQFGGSIHIHGEPLRGTTVTVCLPR